MDEEFQSYDVTVTAGKNAYKREKQLPIAAAGGVHNNPLQWWRDNQFKYPVVSKFARRILCIPATSAPSERVFSAAGLTITDRRAALHGELAASQVMLHQLYKPLEKFKSSK